MSTIKTETNKLDRQTEYLQRQRVLGMMVHTLCMYWEREEKNYSERIRGDRVIPIEEIINGVKVFSFLGVDLRAQVDGEKLEWTSVFDQLESIRMTVHAMISMRRSREDIFMFVQRNATLLPFDRGIRVAVIRYYRDRLRTYS